MGKIRPGNKQNSAINGEWATHVRKRTGDKRITSGKRRAILKKDTEERIEENNDKNDFPYFLDEDDIN